MIHAGVLLWLGVRLIHILTFKQLEHSTASCPVRPPFFATKEIQSLLGDLRKRNFLLRRDCFLKSQARSTSESWLDDSFFSGIEFFAPSVW